MTDNTLVLQGLALIPRLVCQKLQHHHTVGRSVRKFGFKKQFTTMAFIQLTARRSTPKMKKSAHAV